MKTYLVFGANGFIGASLVEQFAKENKVVAIDRFSRELNFKKTQNIEVGRADVTKETSYKKFFDQKGVAGIVWAVGGVVPADTLANEEILNLIEPAIKILRDGFEKKIPIILVSSAGMLYKPGKLLFTENSPVEPWTWYGLQKLIIERSLTLLANDFGNSKFTILRATSVYGERQPTEKSQGVVGKLVKSAIIEAPFVLYGSAAAKRDYLYVGDLAKIVEKAFKQNLKYKVYNVSSGKLYTISELKKIIEHLAGKKIDFQKMPKREIDPASISVSNKRLLAELKNTEFTDIKEGLNNTFKWYKERLS